MRAAPRWAIVGAVLVILAGVVWLVYARIAAGNATVTQTTVVATGLPIVMRTPGGALEIATVTVHERFRRTDERKFLGLPLGTTVSTIQVPVTYRYHIEMRKEWPIYLDGKTATVHAGEVKPALPVAFDTGKMEQYTQSGWARFNKDENLGALLQSITAELQTRAAAPALRELAIGAGRKTVREFVGTWLLKEQGLKRGEGKLVVLFPGETADKVAADSL